MPLRYVDPEVLIELADGTVIWHSYKDSNGDRLLDYHYQFLDPDSDTGYTEFDIWDLHCKGADHASFLQVLGRQAVRTQSTFKEYLERRGIDLHDGEG